MPLIERIRKWYDGELPPDDNDPFSPIIFISLNKRRHWTSRAIHQLLSFCQMEWKWIIGTAIALMGLALAFNRLG